MGFQQRNHGVFDYIFICKIYQGLNNSYPIDKYNSLNTKDAGFESCIPQIHLCGTLALHTHIITLFHVRTLDEEKVEEKVRGGQG